MIKEDDLDKSFMEYRLKIFCLLMPFEGALVYITILYTSFLKKKK